MINSYSPIQKLTEVDNTVYIKRDDLLPFSFGGNKARIAQEFLDDMKRKDMNCMIGYGNARSNLSRVLANLCAAENIECHIVSPSDDDGSVVNTFNEEMCKINGAIFHYCNKYEVAKTIESVINSCKLNGKKPYYINGDITGHGNEAVPVMAYYKAYDEIHSYEEENAIQFDYIFLPVGTGMTQAGLLCGISYYSSNTKVIGISIARKAEVEKDVLYRFVSAFINEQGLQDINNIEYNIDDSYLCGGYGKSNNAINSIVKSMFIKYGIPFDSNYSGKAFWGMKEYLKRKNIHGKKILFIHTGGTPLFFDNLNNLQNSYAIEECYNKTLLLEFLNSIDKLLPVPLSERVNLSEYTDKIINCGKVLSIKDGKEIKAAALFYCNDVKTGKAYITLLATRSSAQKKGFAKKLLDGTEKYCKDHSMKTIALDTDISNTSAIALYSKCGYRIDAIDKKIHMIKHLVEF